ncbi:MAG: DUF4230 domain-containing protein [Lachnospiraceae bacterium]|nr:DUF4230 domain-containing protein [Lachnospiraceae bacterium]
MNRKLKDQLDLLEREDEALDRKRKILNKKLLKEQKRELFFTRLRHSFRLLIILAILVIILIILILFKCGKDDGTSLGEKITGTVEDIVVGEKGKVELVTESTLQKVILDATLYTAVYPYNGVAQVYASDGSGLKYYVSYRAEVKAGIDVRAVRIHLDEENNKITIRLPEVQMYEHSISGDFHYIFTDQKYNTGNTYNEAFTAADSDMTRRRKIGQLDDIIKVAEDSAVSTMKALVEPWVNQVDPEKQYTVEVLTYEK